MVLDDIVGENLLLKLPDELNEIFNSVIIHTRILNLLECVGYVVNYVIRVL